jgi:zinc protease
MTPPALTEPRPLGFPAHQTAVLPSGLTVFAVEDHRLPLISLQLEVLAGHALVPPAQAGLAGLAASLLREGTSARSSQDIARLVDSSGGNLSASAASDTTSLSASFLRSSADLAFDLLADTTIRAVFPEQEIERQRAQALSSLAVHYKDAEYLATVAAARAILGTHPYAWPSDGTPLTLPALCREDLAAFHTAHFAPTRAWLAVAGDLAAEEAFQLAERHFSSWPAAPSSPIEIPPAPQPRAQVLVIDMPGAVQTQIAIGQPAVARCHPDCLPLQVANQALGGSFNSRMNLKLRASEGLTYSAGSHLDLERAAGLFEATTFTRSGKTAAAVRFMLDLIEEWAGNPATQEELDEAKSYLTGSFSLAIEQAAAVARRLLAIPVYNLPADYWATWRERVRGLTVGDLRAAVSRHIRPRALAIVAVGDASQFASRLESFGEVRVVPASQFDPASESLLSPGDNE